VAVGIDYFGSNISTVHAGLVLFLRPRFEWVDEYVHGDVLNGRTD
jgi:hypothetical protein